jgi:FKBP-type peptidyl-prolyl cis-trans isomerase (trigger factor)
MSENTNVKKDENSKGKLRISEKNLAIIITAGILAVIAIATAVVFVVQAIKSDAGFNYLKSDLSKYVEFTEDYKNTTLNIDIAKPKDIDVDVALLKLQALSKTGNGKNKVLNGYSWEIGPGDVVSIYYRGYILGDNGEQIAVDSMSNFASDTPTALEIGSGNFIPGFEYNMIGLMTGDANQFRAIKSGKPITTGIAYVSYTRTDVNDASKKVTVTNERIELSREDLDAVYGDNFKKTITSTEIGTKVELLTELGDKTFMYKDLVVNYVTTCEDKHFTVECYFPYNYGKAELRNETAYFEVYVNGFVDYDAPVIDDAFIKDQISKKALDISEEDLQNYEGANLVEKYHAYGEKKLMENYEKEYETLLRDALLVYFRNACKAIKYPGGKVNEIYEEYYDKVNESYIVNGGKLTNSYGSSTTYQTLDTYAVAYLGLTSGADWKAYITTLAQNAVEERMMLYYIVRNEKLVSSQAEFDKKLEETKDMLVQEYIDQYLAYEGKTKEDYGDKYDSFVEQCRKDVFGYYDEEYFIEATYLEILMDTALTWPEVLTLDERRAYPIGK